MLINIVDDCGVIFKPFDEILGLDELKSRAVDSHVLMSLKSERLSELACALVKRYNIDCIIETGTFKGTGTTASYSKAGTDVYSCEVNKLHYEAALKNIGHLPFIHIDHAASLSLNDLPEKFVERIGRENLPKSENWLEKRLEENKQKNVLVSLDSGGPNGEKEGRVLFDAMEKYDNISCIILDDLKSIKHSKTQKVLWDKYKMPVYQVEDRWGFAIRQ